MRGTSGPFVRSSGVSGVSGPSSARSGGMSILYICLFIVSASALSSHEDTFRYHQNVGRVESCAMCSGADCWPMQGERCRYYAETSERGADSGGSSGGGGGGGSGSESGVVVDTLMHNMMAQAVASWMSQECIPFVSQRTDCNKENICLGCKRCACDAFGRWRCEEVQRCRDQPDLEVDHKVLLSVADALKNVRNRKKRSQHKTPEPQKINHSDLAAWMYGGKLDITYVANRNPATDQEELNPANSKQIITSTPTIYNEKADIEFDEVLNNIAIDNQTYKRRKPQLELRHQFNDYMDIATEDTKSDNTRVSPVSNTKHDLQTTLSEPIDESTKMIIDLLQGSVNNSDERSSHLEKFNVNRHVINIESDSNDTISLDAINIMKRDVSSVSKYNTTTEVTIEIDSTTSRIPELKRDVLIPLNKIIIDKEQELKDLLKMKENLIKFMVDYNETTDVNARSQEIVNNSKTDLSVYNLDIFPEIQYNLRKISPNVMEKLLYKLKRDIYEVIRDVVGVKKITSTKNLPEDLKTLIRAMSFYVRKQGNVSNIKSNNIKLNNYLRRHLITEESMHMNSTKYYLIKILDILDESMQQTETLASLSPNTRTIIKRVIKNNFIDDLSSFGLRGYGPDYNLTNDLENVGTTWQHMTANIENCDPADKIYAMSLFHLTLSAEISKLNDAIALIDFAQSRRMIPIEGNLESALKKIDNGLESIHNKIKVIIMHKKIQKHLKETTSLRPGSQKSFLKKIRNLLKGSKSDIIQLTNKKVPRSEIVKTVARKRLDELAEKRLAEYSQTMIKWQSALNIIPRSKRSVDISKIRNRMNHILPKYLRGKLNPAILKKKTKVKMDTEPTVA